MPYFIVQVETDQSCLSVPTPLTYHELFLKTSFYYVQNDWLADFLHSLGKFSFP